MKTITIIGGGTADISIAARLLRENNNIQINLFEPSEVHYYQPFYTLVGAGAEPKEKTTRPTKDVMPKGVNWIKRKIVSFQPENNAVICEQGETHQYDYLIVAPGIQIDWHLIEGLKETLGKNGVGSFYGYNEAEENLNILKNFKGGKAIFTAGHTPV